MRKLAAIAFYLVLVLALTSLGFLILGISTLSGAFLWGFITQELADYATSLFFDDED